jgi:hypothetical protein
MLRAPGKSFRIIILGTRAIGLAVLYETLLATGNAFIASQATSLKFTLILSLPPRHSVSCIKYI